MDVTGLRNATPNNMQLDAGLFTIGFTVADTVKDAAAFKSALETFITTGTGLVGATRGGGTFVATPETREPEIDGKRFRTKGLIHVDSWDVRLTGTLVEITPGNFKYLLPGADVAAPSGSGNQLTTVTLRNAIAGTDYIDHIQWITLLGDGTYMMIEIDNAINIDGTTLTFQDKNEGTLPFNFVATQSNLTGNSNAPFRIKYFGPATTSGGSGGSGSPVT